MEILTRVALWGIAPNEVLKKQNTDMSLALIDVIELLGAIDRRNVYVAQILQPTEGDYPYRVGYEQNGHKEYWAGETLHLAVHHLRETMSAEGIDERRRLKIPMPGEAN
jgi:hypothetical protein